MEVVIENEAKLLIRLCVKKDYEKEETERRANLISLSELFLRLKFIVRLVDSPP